MKKALGLMAIFLALSGCRAASNEGCIATSSSAGAVLRSERFYALAYLAGPTEVWINSCDRTYPVAAGSEKALSKFHSFVTSSPNGVALRGRLDGQITFSQTHVSSVIRIYHVSDVERLNAQGMDKVRDIMVQSAERERK